MADLQLIYKGDVAAAVFLGFVGTVYLYSIGAESKAQCGSTDARPVHVKPQQPHFGAKSCRLNA